MLGGEWVEEVLLGCWVCVWGSGVRSGKGYCVVRCGWVVGEEVGMLKSRWGTAGWIGMRWVWDVGGNGGV